MDRSEMLERLEKGEDPLDVAIKKWEDIVDGTGVDKGNCALCEVYGCIRCPANKIHLCNSEGLYGEYCYNPTKENAMAVMNALEKLKETEVKKNVEG